MTRRLRTVLFYTLTVLMLVLMMGLLGGCGRQRKKVVTRTAPAAEADTADRKDDAESEKEADAEETDAEADEESSEEEPSAKVANPLEGMDVAYPGELCNGEAELVKLVQFFLEDTGIAAEEIQSVNACDFEADGTCEAFIFAGTKTDDETGTTFTGNMYYTDGKTCEKFEDSSTGMWWKVDGLLKFDGRKYAYATEYYATGGRSIIWSVYDGKAKECEISGQGDVNQLENGQISFVVSSYDVTYDGEIGTMMGHSWKPYYFDYDSDKDCLFEYGGAFIPLDDVAELCGFDLVSQLKQKGYQITFALWRDNGIVTVCYYEKDNNMVTYGNANYDCKAKCYVGFGAQPVQSMEESDMGGVYEASHIPELAVYPTVRGTKTTENIVIQSRDSIYAPGGQVQLNGFAERDWETPVSAVVDENTRFENNPDGFVGSDITGKTPAQWLTELTMSENSMDYCGVYEVEVTNGHADVIKGLYWWD